MPVSSSTCSPADRFGLLHDAIDAENARKPALTSPVEISAEAGAGAAKLASTPIV